MIDEFCSHDVPLSQQIVRNKVLLGTCIQWEHNVNVIPKALIIEYNLFPVAEGDLGDKLRKIRHVRESVEGVETRKRIGSVVTFGEGEKKEKGKQHSSKGDRRSIGHQQPSATLTSLHRCRSRPPAKRALMTCLNCPGDFDTVPLECCGDAKERIGHMKRETI